jgi:anti-sigma factor RsiW
MHFSDEILMAYADGELDTETRQRIEAAMELDPALAQRIAGHRKLRMELGAAFDGVLDEPIPTHLLETAGTSAAANSAAIANLGAVRAAKQRGTKSKRWSWPEWTSIAASLLIGILAGRSALQPSQSAWFATNADGVVATGELSAALDDQLSGASEDAAVWIGLSFRAGSGEYCRTFAANSAAGVACRESDVWKVRALSESAAQTPGSEYRMAGSELPPAILTAVEDTMAGDALDQEQERAARSRGWKN